MSKKTKVKQGPPTTIRELKKRVEAAGYIVKGANNGHFRVTREDGTYVMLLPSSPRESGTSLKNSWARFVRKTSEQRSEAA